MKFIMESYMGYQSKVVQRVKLIVVENEKNSEYETQTL